MRLLKSQQMWKKEGLYKVMFVILVSCDILKKELMNHEPCLKPEVFDCSIR